MRNGKRRMFWKKATAWLMISTMLMTLWSGVERAEAVTGMKLTIYHANGCKVTFGNETFEVDKDTYTHTFNSSNSATMPFSVEVPDHFTYKAYSNSGMTTEVKKNTAGAYVYTTTGGGYYTRNENGVTGYYATSASVYVKLIPDEYSITFVANGGTIQGTKPTKYTYDKSGKVTAFPTATKDKVGFAGWFADEDCTQRVNALPCEYIDGDATLYAGYEYEYSTYRFYVGDKLVDKQVIKQGDELRIPEAVTIDDSKEEFLGWYVESTGKKLDFDNPMRMSEVVNVKAKVAPVYHVYIMTEDFSGKRSVYKTLNARPSNDYKVTIPNDYKGTEGVPLFYYDSEEEKPQEDRGFIPQKTYTVGPEGDLQPDQQLHPMLTDAFWITFMTNGAENPIDSILCNLNEEVNLDNVTIPEKKKYRFEGWHLKPTLDDDAVHTITPKGNTYLYAKYEVDKSQTSSYTIVYWGENANNPGYSTLTTKAVTGKETDSEIILTDVSIPTGVADREYFEFDPVKSAATLSGTNRYDMNRTVSPDDKTVVNLFYKRTKYTLKFTFGNSYTPDASTLPAPDMTPVYANNGSAEHNDAYAYYDASGPAYYIVAKKDQSIAGLWPRPKSTAGGATVEKWNSNWLSTRFDMTDDMINTSGTKSISATWTTTTKTLTLNYYLECLDQNEPGAEYNTTKKKYYSKNNQYTEVVTTTTTSLNAKEIAGFKTGTSSSSGGVVTLYYDRLSYSMDLVNYSLNEQYTGIRFGDDLSKYLDKTPERPQLAEDPKRNSEYVFVGWFTVEPDLISYDATYDKTAGKWIPVPGSTEPYPETTMPDVGTGNSLVLYSYWWHPPVDIDVNVKIVENSLMFKVPYQHSLTDVTNFEVAEGFEGYEGLLAYIISQKKVLLYWSDKYGNIVNPYAKLVEDTEIFAVFLDDGFSVTYNAGTGTIKEGMSLPVDSKLYQPGSEAPAMTQESLLGPLDTYTADENDRMVFVGWLNSLDGKLYYPGECIPIVTDVTLTAQYEHNTEHYAITYHNNFKQYTDVVSTDIDDTLFYVKNEKITQDDLLSYDETGFAERHAATALGWALSSTATDPLTDFRITDAAGGNHVYQIWEVDPYTYVEGEIIWSGDNEKVRPTQVTVKLKRAIEGETATLVTDSDKTVSNTSWEFLYSDLDRFSGDDEYIYSVIQVEIPHYSTSVSGSMAEGFVITNTFTANLITYNGLDGATVSGGTNPDLYESTDPDITLINPTKEGYNFTGWSGSGISGKSKEVTIPTGSTGNKEYTANWEPKDQTVEYSPIQTSDVTPEPTTSPVKYDDLIKIDCGDGTFDQTPEGVVETTDTDIYRVVGDIVLPAPTPNDDDMIFIGWKVEAGSGDVKTIFTAQYETDKVGGGTNGNDTGDGVPDKYQVKVTYTITNGTWNSKTDDIYEYVTLVDTNGKWDTEGTASITKPSNMVADNGYDSNNAAWTVVSGSNTAITNGKVSEATVLNYKFEPKVYTIEYADVDDDYIGSAVDEYTIESENFTLTQPTKKGYTFIGWTSDDITTAEKSVTISKGTTGNLVFTANWSVNSYDVTSQEIQDSDDDPDDETNTLDYGTKIVVNYEPGDWDVPDGLEETANNIYIVRDAVDMGTPEPDDGYMFVGWKVEDGSGDIKLIYTAQYEEDSVGEGPDGIPDIYQLCVIYKVVHGTWEDETTADITEYYTLKDDDGNWDADNGTATITKPTGMSPDLGYEDGAWDISSNVVQKTDTMSKTYTYSYKPIKYDIVYNGMEGATVSGSGNPVQYTIESDAITLIAPTKTGYTFKGWIDEVNKTSASMTVTIPANSTGNREFTATWEANSQTISYLPTQTSDTTPDPQDTSAHYDDKIQVIYEPGTWNYENRNLVATEDAGIYIVQGNVSLGTPEAVEGTVFIGWKVEEKSSGPVKFIYTAQYETDTVGAKDGNKDKGDGVPDIYQVKVTYKVANGTWQDTTTADKYEYVTLKDDAGNWSKSGSAEITKPTGMSANAGYQNGSWDIASNTVTEATAYKYTFATITYHITYNGLTGATVSGNPDTFTVESDDITLNNPTKDGYEFAGWTGTGLSAATLEVKIPKGSTLDRVYTATWIPNPQKVTYPKDKTSDETPENDSTTLSYDDKIKVVYTPGTAWTKPEALKATGTTDVYVVQGDVTLADPTPATGYVFVGWDVAAGSESTGIKYIYTAKYETDSVGKQEGGQDKGDGIPDKYQIKATYQVVNGTWTDKSTADQYEYVTLLDENNNWSESGTATVNKPTGMLANDGYKAGSWNPTSNTITVATTFVYTFVTITYTITYEGLEGATVSGNPDTYTVETATFTLNNPTKTGYTFAGWESTSLEQVSKEVSIAKGSIGDRTYKATWTADPMTVTYPPVQDNDNKPESTITDLFFDEKIQVIYTPGKWTVAQNLTATGTDGVYIVKGNVVLGDPEAPENTIFIGWDVKAGEGDVKYVYTAKYETDTLGKQEGGQDKGDGIPDKYQVKVTYQIKNGTWDGTSKADKYEYVILKDNNQKWSVDGSAPITKPVNMSADAGYENGTWDKADTEVTGAATFVYSYTPITYHLTYEGLEGATVSGNPDTYTVETETFTLNNPTKTGYTFAGWESTSLEQVSKDVSIAKGSIGDRTYKATWTADPMTVTYPPVQDDDNKPESTITDLFFDDKIQVIYTPGKWTVAQNLTATGTDGVYIVKGNVVLGNPEAPENTIFVGWDVKAGEGDVKYVYTAKYENDTLGGDNGKGDGIPDKYQVLITYNVVNGTWNDDTTKELSEYVTLKDENQKWSETGSATVTIPKGMKPYDGYTDGLWNKTVGETAVVTGATDFVYTYSTIIYTISYNGMDGAEVATANPEQYVVETDTFTLTNPTKTGYTFKGWTGTDLNGLTMTVTVANGSVGDREYTANWEANDVKVTRNPEQTDDNEPDPEDDVLKFDDKIQVIYAPGTWTKPDTLKATEDDTVYIIKGDVTISDPVPTKGYIFIGWDVQDGTDDIVKIYIALYEGDELGGKDGNGNDIGDGIPDRYQVLVTYQVENGTWSDSTTDNLSEYVTLKDANGKWSETGSAPITKPEGMLAKDGYKNGAWDSDVTVVTEATTFTYSYTAIVYVIMYNGLDGAEVSGNPDTYTVEDADITLVNPTKTGYTFAGWTGTDLTEASTSVVIGNGSIGNRAFTATWKANDSKITYPAEQTDENEDEDDIDVCYDDKIKVVFEPGFWTVPANLAETSEDGVYVVKGDINLGSAVPVDGEVFIGWRKDAGYGDIVCVFVALYETDTLGGDNGKGDGIPDKYQRAFTFRIVNGTWADDTTEDIVTLETLYDENGKWDEEGSAKVYVPSGMKPNLGYDNGAWDPELPKARMNAAADEIRKQTLMAAGSYHEISASEPNTYTYNYNPVYYEIIYEGVDGAVMSNPDTFTVVSDDITLENPTKKGYVFTGWSGTGLEGEDNMKVVIPSGSVDDRTYTAHWEKDVLGGPNGDSDGIPDKYQTEVTYKVINGTWSNGTTADITVCATLKDAEGNLSEDGSAELALPIGMKPNKKFKELGEWTPEANGTVIITKTSDKVFTFEFEPYDSFSVNYEDLDHKIVPGTIIYGDKITIDPGIGSWTRDGIIYDKPVIIEITEDTDIGPAIAPDGYSFDGWEKKPDKDGKAEFILAAKFITIEYTITYEGIDGAVMKGNPSTYNTETATFVLNNPTKDGYEFKGWTGTDLTEPTMMVTVYKGSTGDRIYTATWEAVDDGPKTGDTANTVSEAMLALLAAGAMFMIFMYKKRREEEA